MSDLDSSAERVAEMQREIGKYRIIRQIAQGGMAEIFLASASGIEGFEKLCVLKRILPMLSGNKEFVEMFLDEARIAASLLHSNIAQVFDIGSDRGSYYFVMELLRGQDVRHILREVSERKERIPYEHVATIITGVCAGLHYAHEMRSREGKPLNIVHRDISPQNVFVTHDGSVKLCDFGIAKSAQRLTETRVGTLKGKVRYMSPEQCQSKPLDRRSDIFSLSIMLWELVAQKRLYNGDGDFEICKAIVETDVLPPSTYRADVPPALEAIVMKGLARDREQRFQTAHEMQLALVEWTRQDRVPSSAIHLATYMEQLFGPPAANETFLDKVSDVDSLAQRIRALNEKEISSGVRATPSSVAIASDSSRDHFSDSTRALNGGAGATPLSLDDSSVVSVNVPRPRAPRWPIVVLALVVAAICARMVVTRAQHKEMPSPVVVPVVDRKEELPVPPTPAIIAPPVAAQPAVAVEPTRHRRNDHMKLEAHPKSHPAPGIDENAIKNPF